MSSSNRTKTTKNPHNRKDDDDDDDTNNEINDLNHKTNNSKEPPPPPPNARNVFRGTLVTLLLRVISFGATQATFRVLDPATLGKAHVQLELLLSSVLFVSREGFRLALTKNISSQNWNVAWLTIPVVTLVSGSALMWHLFVLGGNNNKNDTDFDYTMAGILYCVASWIEGCAEPAVLMFLRQLNIPQRAKAESLAAVAKTMAIVIGLQGMSQSYPVTAFGLAQLVYAVTYAGYLYYQAWGTIRGPDFGLKPLFDWESCRMTLIFTIQGFFKHLLTEADRIVLAAVSDNYNQGVYAMGSAYGGMAARILLQPLEENARLLWSRLAASSNSNSNSNSSDDKSGEEARNTNMLLKQSYVALVKLVLYLGLLFSCVAVNYTNLLLCALAGRKWGSNNEAAAVLSAFCVYTAFLAANGMTEAFVYAIANSAKELTRLGITHTATGVVFAVCAPGLVTRYGTVGLVIANCVAMSIRSIYSIHFASIHFKDDSFGSLAKQLFPHPVVLASFGMAFVATNWSFHQVAAQGLHQVLDIHNKEWLYLTGQHLCVGISSVIGVATMVVSVERPFLGSLKSMFRAKQD
jgi:oligosaccharide translocation protein RFT1